jgi:hypothetical protein
MRRATDTRPPSARGAISSASISAALRWTLYLAYPGIHALRRYPEIVFLSGSWLHEPLFVPWSHEPDGQVHGSMVQKVGVV